MIGKVIVQCGIQIDDEYWFVAGNTNGLFKKKLQTGEIDFVDFFPEESKAQFRAYTDIKLVDNKFIFTPCFAKRIAIYNLDEKLFSSVPLPFYESGINQYLKSVKYKEYIYLIPYSASSFIKYDVRLGQIEILDSWAVLRNKYLGQQMGNFVIEEICTDKNSVYMFMSDKNQVIILDMDTDQFQLRAVNISNDERICSVCRFDKSIYIATNKNKIYMWNFVNNETTLITDFNQYINYLDCCINHICLAGRRIYLINVYRKNIVVFDYINNEFSVINMSKYIEDKKDDNVSLYYYYDIQNAENDRIQLFSFYTGRYLLIEGDRVTDLYGEFFFPTEYWKRYFNNILISDNTLKNLKLPFSDVFRNGVLNEIIGIEENQRESFGERIYDALMKVEE